MGRTRRRSYIAAQRPQDPLLRDQIAGQQAKLADVQERNEAGMARYEAGMAALRAGEMPAPSPAEVSADGAPRTGAASAPAEDKVAELKQWAADMKRARPKMRRYEKQVHAVLDGQMAAGLIDQAAYELLLNEALSD